ncbi:hypothetical protein [Methylorubrum extorquens]|uniref:Uncharacterized protein n=1 Tax=Methylorubrum extorquens (strain ATCC 14718 / DSM 1338 / JCM 2805 / NCIMB 9133 / AM1) TaxID=272630 RepID=C5B6W5_METEA|nr:hypothetical protein [Methylorubrum extorquens]ACS44197.1 Hypothetical protein MexAM1_p3METAp0023 [Methylorubrum extorquens AM1]MCP1591984.1 hypothetical protein [Methylorubrum extorquens]
MSRRSLSWSNAKCDMQADRVQVPAGFLGARSRVEVFARLQRRPLVVAGKFDLSAIMAAAAVAADAHQERFGCSRREAMSVALKAAWQAARTTRARAAH